MCGGRDVEFGGGGEVGGDGSFSLVVMLRGMMNKKDFWIVWIGGGNVGSDVGEGVEEKGLELWEI